MGAFLERLSVFVQTHARPITVFVAILVLGALWAASSIRVETNLLEYFKPSSSLRQELSYIEPRLSGVGTVDISVQAGKRDALRDPVRLAVIESLQKFAMSLPGVDRTMSFVDFLKDMNMSFHNEHPEYHVIPESRELVSQYLLLYDSDEFDEFITPEYDQARILIRISEHSSAGQAEIIRALRAFIDGREHDDLEIRVTGRAVQDVNTIDALVRGQVASLLLAAAVITFIMFLALRSIVAGALSLIPNAFPIIVNFGIMGGLGIPLNTSTALISVVALGIAVDDTIHFLSEYNRNRAGNLPTQEALRRSILEKGVAISATSLILVIGFSVLLLSNFVPTMSFGGLSAVIMVTAWIGDMIVLPAAMLSIQGKNA